MSNPVKAKGSDHVVYKVTGVDLKTGKRFEVLRRYSEFEALREVFVTRWPGLYVPNVPTKRGGMKKIADVLGNAGVASANERCFLLNLFFRQVARCPYLTESKEFGIFIRADGGQTSSSKSLKQEMQLLPKMSPEKHLKELSKYFSIPEPSRISTRLLDEQ